MPKEDYSAMVQLNTRAKVNNLVNVVNNRCSQLFTVNNHCSIIADNHQQPCFINYCGLLFQQALEQLQLFIVNTKQILIDHVNIVNSTGVVELTMRQRDQRVST